VAPPVESSPSPPAPAPLPQPTLWERLGDQTKMESAVDEWVTLSLADVKVDLTKGGSQKLEGEELATCKRKLTGYISALSDGTVPFVGKKLTDVNANIPTQGEGFTAFVGHLRTALSKVGASSADIDALIKKVEETK